MWRQFRPVIDGEVKRYHSTDRSGCFGFCSFVSSSSSSSTVAAVKALNLSLQGTASGLSRHLVLNARVGHYEQFPRGSYSPVDDNNGLLHDHTLTNGSTDDPFDHSVV